MPRKTKSQKGHYYELSPIDLAIIAQMPTEGQMLGWHPIADTVKTLEAKLNKDLPREGWATHEQITGRLVSMNRAGYVVRVKLLAGTSPSSSGMGWQRTAKGEEFYEETTGSRVPGNTQKQLGHNHTTEGEA